MCRGIPEQTVERRGSLVFCVCKSDEAERERLEPLERHGLIASAVEQHERVCEGLSDTDSDSNDTSGFNKPVYFSGKALSFMEREILFLMTSTSRTVTFTF